MIGPDALKNKLNLSDYEKKNDTLMLARKYRTEITCLRERAGERDDKFT